MCFWIKSLIWGVKYTAPLYSEPIFPIPPYTTPMTSLLEFRTGDPEFPGSMYASKFKILSLILFIVPVDSNCLKLFWAGNGNQ